MLTPAQKIILSKVSPVIPNSEFEKIFKRNNVKLCSRISTLKAGMTDPEYAHILSFRRHPYIDPDDIGKIPSTFLITFEDTSYRILTSIDSLLCFRCKQEGHLTKNCPLTQNSNITDTTILNTNTTIPTPIQSPKLPVKKIPITTETNIDISKQATNKLPSEQPPIPFSSKRPLSQSSTDDKPDYTNLNNTDSMPPPINPHKKKIAITKLKILPPQSPVFDSAKLEEMLAPAREIINKKNPSHSQLNYSQIKSLLQDTFRSAHSLQIAKNYTDNILTLVQTLEEIYPHLNERSIKNRIHRLCKNLSKSTDAPESSFSCSSESDIEFS